MREKVTRLLPRVYAFASTLALSVAIVNALPAAKQQRQRSFAAAIMNGDFQRVRMLRFAGANVNSRSDCCLPLFLAAGERRLDVVRYLLDQGAEVNGRETMGDTALTEATYYGRLAIVKELLFRGADVNMAGDNGTALDIAIKRKHAVMADLLRHYGGRKACELRKCG